MKVSVYLKKNKLFDLETSFSGFGKNMDIKAVSPSLVVYDKYRDTDTLSYKRTIAVPVTEQITLARTFERNHSNLLCRVHEIRWSEKD